jgi:cellulose synthase/poly-beta-1,6-N-acetylglucosamine synthase-like glycosyltransferase
MEDKKPLYFLKMNPRNWRRASLPKLKTSAQEAVSAIACDRGSILGLPWSQRNTYLGDLASQKQEERWEEETGVKPGASYLTLIVPIHNEERNLPSLLGTLMLSNVPAAVNMQVIFVTNACTDASVAMLRTFLSGLGEIAVRETIGRHSDQGMEHRCAVVEKDHVIYIHVNTLTAGKANALGIGNIIARQSGHIIAMSVDANNFIEPDAIRVMFSHASRHFRAVPRSNDTVLLSGVGKESVKASRLEGSLTRISFVRRHLVEVGGGVVNGWMMAWNTAWMNDLGGPPAVALEDYALGVLARSQGFKIEQAVGVNVWGYVVNDFKGLLDTRARYVRGKRQIYDYVNGDPAVVALIENEAFYMKKFRSRIGYVIRRTVHDPLHTARYIATFLLWEYAIWKGMREYRRNPKNQSWEKIGATY